jgi:hypothetical protein
MDGVVERALEIVKQRETARREVKEALLTKRFGLALILMCGILGVDPSTIELQRADTLNDVSDFLAATDTSVLECPKRAQCFKSLS